MSDCSYCDKNFSSDKARLEHELDEHREEMTGHDKSNKKSELNKLEQKTKAKKHERKKKVKYGGIAAVLGIMLIGGGFLAVQTSVIGSNTNSSIGVGEPVHWHADYQITVCGENKVPQGGPMLAHTHGETQFHLEGVRQSEEQATLGWVMDRLGTEFSEDSIYGKTSCNGEDSTLTVKANGDELENPQDYIIRDGDSIKIKLA